MTGGDGEEKATAADQAPKTSTGSAAKGPVENAEVNDRSTKDEAATPTAEAVAVTSPTPSITISILVFWIIPVLLLAVASHYAIDTEAPPKPNVPKNRPVSINMEEARRSANTPKKMMMERTGPTTAPSPTPRSRSTTPRPSALPSASSSWPTSYKETVETIQRRNRKIPRVGTSRAPEEKKSASSSKKIEPSKPTSAGRNTPPRDPARQQYEDRIDEYRRIYEADPGNVLKAVKLADALRLYDVTYHDGGTKQPEALRVYEKAIDMSVEKRNRKLENGEETNLSLSGTRDVGGEVMMDYSQKSIDGLLCALYTAKGKLYFMANMFERAVETYSKCLELEPLYLDALG